MNLIRKIQGAPMTDVERWVGKLADLKRQCSENEQATAAALIESRDALLNDLDAGGATDKVSRLEAHGRGLALAIEEATSRLEQAREAEKAARRQQAIDELPKLEGEMRAAHVEYGRLLVQAIDALQRIHAASGAYGTAAGELRQTDKSRSLPNPLLALKPIVEWVRDLETTLGAEDFQMTGLPRYTQIKLEN